MNRPIRARDAGEATAVRADGHLLIRADIAGAVLLESQKDVTCVAAGRTPPVTASLIFTGLMGLSLDRNRFDDRERRPALRAAGVETGRDNGMHALRQTRPPGRDSIDGWRLRDHEHMESWTIKYFSQANPEGTGQDDVPALLRRVADSIEDLGLVEVQDFVMHTEITADGYRPSLTVYYHDAED